METVRLRAVAYITGGFYENIPQSLPDGLSAKIHREDVRVLPTFDEIARAGEISDRDMFNTFNMEEAEWQILSLAAEQAARRQHPSGSTP